MRQLPHMTTRLNPVDNFFNSTISTGGGTSAVARPNSPTSLASTATGSAVPEGTIPNGAKGASSASGTSGDTYFFGGIAFDTLIRAPNLEIDKNAEPTTANPGDVVTYTTTVTNPQRRPATPTEAATNLVIDDPLPSGLDFVDFADQSGQRVLLQRRHADRHCNVGTLEPDATFSFAYRATGRAPPRRGLHPPR